MGRRFNPLSISNLLANLEPVNTDRSFHFNYMNRSPNTMKKGNKAGFLPDRSPIQPHLSATNYLDLLEDLMPLEVGSQNQNKLSKHIQIA
ncbi:unnamed protein product [Ceratitis capitata]|uniref:(Mediterranean fruit fly) hypothetical protein n=1 Tax=Ceratitis capitata TaxID=7213 RepID=A0A811USN3_CERCA|nr:unnamed protein product [Ceratitis capitata]